MLTEDFNFDLPKEFIAQSPTIPRDSSRLFVFDTKNNEIFHKNFHEIDEFLQADDLMVLNRSKVIPARIIFFIDKIEREIFLLKKIRKNCYEVFVRPGRIFNKNFEFRINNDIGGRILDIYDDGRRLIEFYSSIDKDSFMIENVLEEIGEIPLPPYIKNQEITFDEYQTVYAREKGSVAAPTAGLHFTKDLIDKLKNLGILFSEVVLHVGAGTFLPVKTDKITEHLMHDEEFALDIENAEILNNTNKSKRRIVAVGTTTVRVLESIFTKNNLFAPMKSSTDIFIYPGKYKWKIVDSLITNFHLPKSTLIMLVASFLEHKGLSKPVEKILEMYEIAKKEGYRFYSFGDAMMII